MKKISKMLYIPEEVYKRIKFYQRKHSFTTMTSAITQLLVKSLDEDGIERFKL